MKNTKTLSELEDKYIGIKGSPERDKYEKELSDLMIGFKVRDARIKLDLTQAELAKRIGADKGYISRIERGLTVPTVATLYKIAAAMGLTVELKPV